jgi:hypothetical protein
MRLVALCAAFTLVWGCGGAWAADLSEEEELAMGFGEKSVVSIATSKHACGSEARIDPAIIAGCAPV